MRYLLLGLLVTLFMGTCVFAQDDPIELVRTYPPEMLSEQQATTGMDAIEWQLEQKESNLEVYRTSLDQWKTSVRKLRDEITNLKGNLSPEIRLLDKEGRSRLVGKIMEERINGTLELATREKSIELLEQSKSGTSLTQSKFQRMDLEILLKAAELKLKSAETENSEVAKLVSGGFQNPSELRKTKYAHEIAQLEFEAARNQIVLHSNQAKAESAKRIADERVQLEPIKARINAASQYLEKFTTGVDVIEKIELINQSIALWEKDIQILAKKMATVSSEFDELQVLKDRVEERLKNSKKRKKINESNSDEPFEKK